jgi:hypothetical protein
LPDEPTSEPAGEQALPDLRVVSVIHDADNDRLGLAYDDDLDPFHALGLLMAGWFRQLQDCADALDLEDAFDEPEDDA